MNLPPITCKNPGNLHVQFAALGMVLKLPQLEQEVFVSVVDLLQHKLSESPAATALALAFVGKQVEELA